MEAVGVSSVRSLLEQQPADLALRMSTTNNDLRLSPEGSPGADRIASWIGAAKLLEDIGPTD